MPDCRPGLAWSNLTSWPRRSIPMFGGLQVRASWPAHAASPALAALASMLLLAGCSGSLPDLASSSGAPSPPATHIGEGAVKAALIVPLSGSGNAGVAAQSMRNAAEMALAEFNNPDLQLLVKDDAGSVPGAQQAAQQALDEGAEIILGPLFALTVAPVAHAARARGVPGISFSTDTNAAARSAPADRQSARGGAARLEGAHSHRRATRPRRRASRRARMQAFSAFSRAVTGAAAAVPPAAACGRPNTPPPTLTRSLWGKGRFS